MQIYTDGLALGNYDHQSQSNLQNPKNYQGIYSSSQSIELQLYSITQHLRLDRRMTNTDRFKISDFRISKAVSHLKNVTFETGIHPNIWKFCFFWQFSKILRFSKFSKFYICKVILHVIDSLPPWLPAQTVTWNENQHSDALTLSKFFCASREKHHTTPPKNP